MAVDRALSRVVLGVSVGLLFVLVVGCTPSASKGQTGGRSESATDVVRAQRPRFDGARAMANLRAQCAFGPRIPGTEAHRRCRDWLVTELKRYTDRVEVQDFTYRTLALSNIVAYVHPKAKRQVLLCAHWDTRPVADEEINPARRRQPVPGANDGASGVAVLLEIARLFHSQQPEIGVVIALFDGEDYGDFARDEGVFLGSRRFARSIKDVGPLSYGILLDMVGDRDLRIYREAISDERARAVNDRVFGVAKRLRYSRYIVDQVRYTISDDHVPINDAGVPCIDLIDFDYPYWHTVDDTPDKCSSDSLAIVGETVAEVIYSERSDR